MLYEIKIIKKIRKNQRGKIKMKQRGMGKMYGVDLVSL